MRQHIQDWIAHLLPRQSKRVVDVVEPAFEPHALGRLAKVSDFALVLRRFDLMQHSGPGLEAAHSEFANDLLIRQRLPVELPSPGICLIKKSSLMLISSHYEFVLQCALPYRRSR
jgi:hypothetical protein